MDRVNPATTDPETIFLTWFRDHRGILFKIARSFAASAADQDELFQEMLFQLWRSAARFRGESKASTWVYRVCFHTAQTWRRGEERREYWKGALAAEPAPEAPSSVACERSEALGALYRAVRGLPEAERTLVLLLLDGQSYREIAEVTGLTENHVGVALSRARKKLAAAMQEVRREL
ncbi:MAG: hypothetical protein C0502_03975 [Opitutus sp.]|nr:hypothetical protein [Opitutus sp.]